MKISVYGLTGNMGCGKSTVAEFLDKYLDVAVFDADQMAKDVLLEKQHSDKLIELLGPEIFLEGELSFSNIAEIVFSNKKLLRKYENFLHPLTWESIKEKIEELGSEVSFIVVEAALLYEADWQKFFDKVIVTICNKTEQYRRIRGSMSLSNSEIRKRLSRQLASKHKRRIADFVIDTDCHPIELESKIYYLYCKLKGGCKK